MKLSTKTLVVVKSAVVASVAVFALSGCMVVVDGDKHRGGESQSEWESRQSENRDHIADLELGNSLDRVLNTMGTPDFDEQLMVDDTRYRVLYYRTQWVKGDGRTTRDECTPLVFADGELQGWGESKLRMIENKI